MKRLIQFGAVLLALATSARAETQMYTAAVSVTTTVKKITFRDNRSGGTWAPFKPSSILIRSASASAQTCYFAIHGDKDDSNVAAKTDHLIAAGEGFEYSAPAGQVYDFVSVVCPSTTATFYIDAQGDRPGARALASAAVEWINPDAGVTATGSSLAKVGTGGATGADGLLKLNSADGYVSFTITEVTTLRAFGLDAVRTTHTQASIDFCISILANGTYDILENNTSRATGSTVALDVWRIEVIAGTLYYKKNGLVIWTSAGTVAYPFFLVTDLNTTAGTITSATRDLSGAWIP